MAVRGSGGKELSEGPPLIRPITLVWPPLRLMLGCTVVVGNSEVANVSPAVPNMPADICLRFRQLRSVTLHDHRSRHPGRLRERRLCHQRPRPSHRPVPAPSLAGGTPLVRRSVGYLPDIF